MRCATADTVNKGFNAGPLRLHSQPIAPLANLSHCRCTLKCRLCCPAQACATISRNSTASKLHGQRCPHFAAPQGEAAARLLLIQRCCLPPAAPLQVGPADLQLRPLHAVCCEMRLCSAQLLRTPKHCGCTDARSPELPPNNNSCGDARRSPGGRDCFSLSALSASATHSVYR